MARSKKTGPKRPPPIERTASHSGWREWIWSIGVALVLALLIRWPLVEPFKIPSGSMEPTFLAGDRIFVNKFGYGVRWPLNGIRFPGAKNAMWYAESRIWNGAEPQRWDVIVFKAVAPDALHNTLVKRIVGLPGEHIQIRDGRVYVNWEPVEFPESMPQLFYTSPRNSFSQMKYGVLPDEEFSVVPQGHYLVLGDNSGNSQDGRYFGWLPNHHILGRVTSIWWPLDRTRDLTGFTSTMAWQVSMGLLAVAVLLRLFVYRFWRVEFGGLGEALAPGDHLLINRIGLGLPIPFTNRRFFNRGQPQRGEVVLYRTARDSEGAGNWLVGRIAGLPGEQVFLDEGRLRINGKALQTPDPLSETHFTSDGSSGLYARSKGRDYSHVPESHFFVLVDDDSEMPDSRTLGWIPRERLVGTLYSRWWPLSRKVGEKPTKL